jgi:hypothetical protein
MTGLWRRLQTRLRPAPIDTADALRAFLEQRAALLAQKCAVDYCRGKTGLASYALFTEQPFLKVFDVCRWETFAAVLGDLVILTEGQLRSQVAAEQQPRLRAALLELYSAVLRAAPPLAHRPQGWSDTVESFAHRLKEASLEKVRPAVEVADYSGKRLFDTLPIHISMRELDEEIVYGAVRFRMIAVSQEMQRRLAPADLARALIG